MLDKLYYNRLYLASSGFFVAVLTRYRQPKSSALNLSTLCSSLILERLRSLHIVESPLLSLDLLISSLSIFYLISFDDSTYGDVLSALFPPSLSANDLS